MYGIETATLPGSSRGRRPQLAAAVVGIALMLAGCTSGSSTGAGRTSASGATASASAPASSGSAPATVGSAVASAGSAAAGPSSVPATSGTVSGSKSSIVVATGSPPLSLDPAKNGNTADMQLVMDLAYEPLITLQPDGSFAPGLAASWKYTDKTLTTFDLNLRPDVKFSDGKPLTADAVVASINHEKSANGPVAVYVNAIKSAQAVGPLEVQLNLVQANPTIALTLTQRFLIGDIVGPDASANPSILGTSTDGAGPYMLDQSATVTGDHYTFVPNPYYFDKSAVHFKTFIVKVIPNPQTALNALKTGQVSYVDGDFTSAPAALSAGLAVHSTLESWYAVFLFDRDGAVVPALKSQLVREALNYATDRAGIANAVFGAYAKPNDEISLPGYEGEGYDPDYATHYTYDVAKAKQLLAQAGYPKGFDITIGATNAFGDGVVLTQAIANDWAKIGVKVNIKSYPDISSIIGPWQSKQLPAVTGGYDGQPLFVEAGQALVKAAGLFNPFQTDDPQLTSLINQAYATTDPSAAQNAWNAVERRVVDLGWFVPLATVSALYFTSKDLQGVDISPTSFAPNPTLFHF